MQNLNIRCKYDCFKHLNNKHNIIISNNKHNINFKNYIYITVIVGMSIINSDIKLYGLESQII